MCISLFYFDVTATVRIWHLQSYFTHFILTSRKLNGKYSESDNKRASFRGKPRVSIEEETGSYRTSLGHRLLLLEACSSGLIPALHYEKHTDRNTSWQKLLSPRITGLFSSPYAFGIKSPFPRNQVNERDTIIYHVTNYKHDLNCNNKQKKVRILASASLWMSSSGPNYYARTVSSVIRYSQGFIVLVNQKFFFAESNHIYMNYQFSNCYAIIKIYLLWLFCLILLLSLII